MVKITADNKEHKVWSHVCQKTSPRPLGKYSGDIWGETDTAFDKNNIIAVVQHGGGSVKAGCWFSASGPARLDIINGAVNAVASDHVGQNSSTAM